MANKVVVSRDNFNTLVNDNAALSGAAFTGDVSVAGNLTVSGTTSTVINLDISDNLIGLNNGLTTGAESINDAGIIIARGNTGANAFMGWDESEDKFTVGLTTATASSLGDLTITTGTLVANLEGNVTGNADTATKIASITNTDIVLLTATQELTNKTLIAPALGTPVSGNLSNCTFPTLNQDTSGNATTATKIASITNTDIVLLTASQELTNKTLVAPALGTPASGDLSNCTFPTLNQSTTGNAVTATTAATVTTAAQTAITSVGTLTGLTMADSANIVINATTGTKIGTATGQKIGFFGKAPVVQQANIADASSAQSPAVGAPSKVEFDGLRNDVQNLTTKMNAILTALEALGLLANA